MLDIVGNIPISALDNVIDALLQQLLIFCQGKSVAQQHMEDFEEEFAENDGATYEGREYDALTELAADVVSAIAESMGQGFIPRSMPFLQVHYKLFEAADHRDRVTSSGFFAEFVAACGVPDEFSQEIVKLALAALRDPHASGREMDASWQELFASPHQPASCHIFQIFLHS